MKKLLSSIIIFSFSFMFLFSIGVNLKADELNMTNEELEATGATVYTPDEMTLEKSYTTYTKNGEEKQVKEYIDPAGEGKVVTSVYKPNELTLSQYNYCTPNGEVRLGYNWGSFYDKVSVRMQ